MNVFKFGSRAVIKLSFNFSVWLIEKLNNTKQYDQKLAMLRKFPKGTLGYDIAKCLDDHKLRLVPGFESHDLKHVLLDFKMTPVDEIRMQAFMLGNRNYSFPCFAIFTFGAILLPCKWTTLYKDFKRGRVTLPISTWTIEEFANLQTTDLQNMISEPDYSQSFFTMKNVIKYGALSSIFAGVAGMIICLPFLFSPSLADLVGAGFAFIGGAILAAGGLLTLSNVIKPQLQANTGQA